ncbi:MAG: UDP-glucose/GDP-mannose dehydrogenase family protein [Firmicutes bacterium]|nr:UDP-glucose/GDP-mannose dehydrogenase family protein [Bacillota bacterium]
MLKIAVLGTGYVGLTTGIGLANFGCNVLCLDIDESKIANLKQGKMPIYEPGMEEVLHHNIQENRLNFSCDINTGILWAEIVFIAVGTPQGEDGRADLSAVYQAAEMIGRNLNNYKVVITKSTVPIGTNEKIKEIIGRHSRQNFDIVSNPEFLREGRALYDFLHPDRVVIGTETNRPLEIIRKIYRPLYLNEVPFVFTDLRTAELIKYSSNCFLATKVAFINELARLCDVVGADIQTVAYALGKDGRIGGKFLHPGPGFGGSCFPKDTRALCAMARDLGMPLEIIETVIESNQAQKFYMVHKIKKFMKGLADKKIAILGLAFKSDTDDIRESPALIIVDQLLAERAVISVYDPQAMGNARKIWGNRISYCKNEYEAVSQADGTVILTEWNQFRNLNLEKIASLMRGKYFFDFRNIYKWNEVEASGLIYVGIGNRQRPEENDSYKQSWLQSASAKENGE